MTDKDMTDEVTGETTSALPRFEFFKEPDALPTVGPDIEVSGIERLAYAYDQIDQARTDLNGAS